MKSREIEIVHETIPLVTSETLDKLASMSISSLNVAQKNVPVSNGIRKIGIFK